jgi:hypothetical protein
MATADEEMDKEKECGLECSMTSLRVNQSGVMTDRQTHRQTDGRTDRECGLECGMMSLHVNQSCVLTDRQTDRQIDRQTDNAAWNGV